MARISLAARTTRPARMGQCLRPRPTALQAAAAVLTLLAMARRLLRSTAAVTSRMGRHPLNLLRRQTQVNGALPLATRPRLGSLAA